jgi:peptidoglycan/xylan/chitin deacetylase (PgdA/CDA1 family)
MAAGSGFVRTAAKRALRWPPLRATAVRWAAARHRGLVLVYHRIVRGPDAGTGIIPSIPHAVLREHIQALLEMGDVGGLTGVVDRPTDDRRPRFAVTFDDDYRTHHDVVLPLLRELGVTATFFVCGRSLRDMGPTWFEVLDALVRQDGLHRTSTLIGAEALSAEELASACERSEALQRAVIEHQDTIAVPEDRLEDPHIAALAEANMTIGFHTLNHLVLPSLDERRLRHELIDGRDAVETSASQEITLFAYPHGKADARTAAAARDAGYEVAVTGMPRASTPNGDPFLVGRWEPGPSSRNDFLVEIAAKLNRPQKVTSLG